MALNDGIDRPLVANSAVKIHVYFLSCPLHCSCARLFSARGVLKTGYMEIVDQPIHKSPFTGGRIGRLKNIDRDLRHTSGVNVSCHRESADETHGLYGVHSHQRKVPEIYPVCIGVLDLVHLAYAGFVFLWHLGGGAGGGRKTGKKQQEKGRQQLRSELARFQHRNTYTSGTTGIGQHRE